MGKKEKEIAGEILTDVAEETLRTKGFTWKKLGKIFGGVLKATAVSVLSSKIDKNRRR